MLSGFNLVSFYDCFSPVGACTYRTSMDPLSAGETVVSYENGARMESSVDMVTGRAVSKVYGPDPLNTYCGEVTSNLEGDTVIRPAAGGEYILRTTDSGAMELECDGFVMPLGGAQQDALIACGGTGEGGDSGCEPAAGGFMAPCFSSFDCDDGYECCGPPGGELKCMSSEMCVTYEMACESDNECDPGTVCCSNGYFDMCLPPMACQQAARSTSSSPTQASLPSGRERPVKGKATAP